MLGYSESPPPLHHSPATSDRALHTSRESTPRTPVELPPAPLGRRTDKDRSKDSQLPWFRKPLDIGIATTSLYLDSPLPEPDFDDQSFPLFGASPPARSMGGAAPIDINSRQASTSPRGQQSSTLTSALQRNSASDSRQSQYAHADGRAENLETGKSVNMGESVFLGENGAKPISMAGASGEKGRRESIAQSMTGGMSWGGISVGSWIRDDLMMSGTSPFPNGNSPSYHSSSYLPKLEANFMRDFACCNIVLPSLHDLLQHYEEAHAQKPSQTGKQSTGNQVQMPDARAAMVTNTAAAVQQQARQQQQQQQQQPINFTPMAPAPNSSISSQAQPIQLNPSTISSNLQHIPDMDTVEDMEMDDVDLVDEQSSPPRLYTLPRPNPQSPQAQFNQPQQPRVSRLNMNVLQSHQGLRTSTPTTPTAQGRPFQNNPTVSSVNTPTLMSNPMQQQLQDPAGQYRETPDSSAPGTPTELDEGIMSSMGEMAMQNNPLMTGNQNANSSFGGFVTNSDMLDLCIDEPAKRLFSPTGGYSSPNRPNSHVRLDNAQYGPNSDIARRIRKQQMLAGLPDTMTGMMPNDEPKPFSCPVIGCEKAYKNQNGLKYHKSHGHNKQQLRENKDGTFQILDPATKAPYEGTTGMEKEKPYKCETCGKRYKNLNGLKYHKSHSLPCSPELQHNSIRGASASLMPSQNHAMGLSGAGFPGVRP